MRTSAETAILLAAILNRSGQTRARVSVKTIKLLSQRKHLRSAFLIEIIEALAEHSWILFEIGTGGCGAIKASSLEAAKPVTAKRFLSDAERKMLKGSEMDWSELQQDASPEQGDDDSGDDD